MPKKRWSSWHTKRLKNYVAAGLSDKEIVKLLDFALDTIQTKRRMLIEKAGNPTYSETCNWDKQIERPSALKEKVIMYGVDYS